MSNEQDWKSVEILRLKTEVQGMKQMQASQDTQFKSNQFKTKAAICIFIIVFAYLDYIFDWNALMLLFSVSVLIAAFIRRNDKEHQEQQNTLSSDINEKQQKIIELYEDIHRQ